LPGQIIQWDAEWGDESEVVADEPLAAWLAEKKMYDSFQGEG
jgi:hypothetical protein